jgi:hypothetical protein
MYLESSIIVGQSPPKVWAFFADPQNLARWDRSVERVVQTSAVPVGVGFTFDTYGPATDGAGFRSSYEVTEYRPGEYVWVDLMNSKWFSRARWLTAVEPSGVGTRIRVGLAVTPRWRYFFLWPVLRLSAPAIGRDLGFLKRALESESVSTPRLGG